MKKVAIIALGWLGNALYDYLEQKGHPVIGTFHSKPKNKPNEIQYDFHCAKPPAQVLDAETIVFNLTPSAIGSVDLFSKFLNTTQDQEVIFISSTSVYGQNGNLTEADNPLPKTNNGKLLLQCEQALLKRENGIIIRPGGLYGGSRHPGNFLSGKTNISGPNSPINLTSRDDLIKVIYKCLIQPKEKVINAVNKSHPNKKQYYEKYCSKRQLALPEFNENDSVTKIVNTIHADYIIDSPLP